MPTTQFYNRTNNSVTYANPTNPGQKVTFKTTVSSKNLGNARVPNYRTDIIFNALVRVTDPDQIDAAAEALSVRLVVSGSNVSQSNVRLLAKSLSSQVDSWADSNVFVGFEPTTPPDFPTLI